MVDLKLLLFATVASSFNQLRFCFLFLDRPLFCQFDFFSSFTSFPTGDSKGSALTARRSTVAGSGGPEVLFSFFAVPHSPPLPLSLSSFSARCDGSSLPRVRPAAQRLGSGLLSGGFLGLQWKKEMGKGFG